MSQRPLNERDLPWLAAPLQSLHQHARSHALLLHGAVGSGLFELALRAAQAWLCEQPAHAPCDACGACHLVAHHVHADLRVLMPEALAAQMGWQAADTDEGDEPKASSSTKRKPSREIKVEAIRQAIDWAHTSTARGRGKVLLIHPADAMNEVSANALLKTLEEPAPGMRILLCCADPERLLPTIRSRCQRVHVVPPSTELALDWLRTLPIEHPEVLLHAAGGQPLAARDLAAAGLSAEVWTQLPAQVAAGDARSLALLPLPEALSALQRLCHDLMAVNAGGHARYFPAVNLPRQLSWPALRRWSEELTRLARHADHPWNAPLLLETLVAQAQHALHSGPARPTGQAAAQRPGAGARASSSSHRPAR